MVVAQWIAIELAHTVAVEKSAQPEPFVVGDKALGGVKPAAGKCIASWVSTTTTEFALRVRRADPLPKAPHRLRSPQHCEVPLW